MLGRAAGILPADARVLQVSWHIALALLFLAFSALSFGVCKLCRWHARRFLRIPYSVLNAHKITPRFSVGTDLRRLGQDTQ